MSQGFVLDFPLLLKNELDRRRRANSRYSQGAFAKSLGLDPAYLSKIFNGRRKPTREMVEKIGRRLRLDEHQLAILAHHASSPDLPIELRPLEQDRFRVVAEWYHLALLELVPAPFFKDDPAWIAQELGITVEQAVEALDRLSRTGFLERSETGAWRLSSRHNSTTQFPGTSEALRSYQTQVLAQAADALNEVPIEERDQSAVTFLADERLLSEAKALIRNFRRELAVLMSSGTQGHRVYTLSVSLFPVSKGRGAARKAGNA
jgi:transcriptional regulator with XRE-family HTH domain